MSYSIEVQASIYDQNGLTRFGLSERVTVEQMSYEQLGELLRGFHVITEAIKNSRNLEVNGQQIRWQS